MLRLLVLFAFRISHWVLQILLRQETFLANLLLLAFSNARNLFFLTKIISDIIKDAISPEMYESLSTYEKVLRVRVLRKIMRDDG